MPTWIEFRLSTTQPASTSRWCVVTKSGIGVLLGEVRWYGQWRKYAFFPNRGLDLVFEETCLRDIAAFCEEHSKLKRAEWRKRRAS